MNLIFSKFIRSCNCKCRAKAKHLRMKLVKTLPDSIVHFAVKFLSATLSSSWTPFLPVWLPQFSPVLPAEINTVHYLENQKMQSWCSQTSTGVCVCGGGVGGGGWRENTGRGAGYHINFSMWYPFKLFLFEQNSPFHFPANAIWVRVCQLLCVEEQSITNMSV